MNKIIILTFLLIILSYPVYAEIIDSNKELIDYGNNKLLTIYGGDKFILNSEDKYDHFTNVVPLKYDATTNEFIINYNKETYKIIPYVICDYNKIPLNKLPFDSKVMITKNNDYYEIAVEFKDVKCILDDLVLDFSEFGEIETNGRQILNDKLAVDMTDYINSGYSLDLNKEELSIGNIALDETGSVILDPYITIYGSSGDDGRIMYRNGTFNELNTTLQFNFIGQITSGGNGSTYDWYNYFVRFDTTSIKSGYIINDARFNFYNLLGTNENCYFSFYNISDFGTLDPTDWGNHSPKLFNNTCKTNITMWHSHDVTNKISKGSYTAFLINTTKRGNGTVPSCWSLVYTFDYPLYAANLVVNYSEIISCNISTNPLLGLNRRIPVLCTLSVIDDKSCVINVYGQNTLLSSSPKSEYIRGIGISNGFKSHNGLLHGYYDSFMMESGQNYEVKVICSDGITKYIQTVIPQEKGLSEMQGTLFWSMDNLAILAVSLAFLLVLMFGGYKLLKSAWG